MSGAVCADMPSGAGECKLHKSPPAASESNTGRCRLLPAQLLQLPLVSPQSQGKPHGESGVLLQRNQTRPQGALIGQVTSVAAMAEVHRSH